MNRSVFALTTLVLGLAPRFLPAQVDRILGLERGAGTSAVKLDQFDTACARVSQCALAALSPHIGNLGGTAYDSSRGREWSSDGPRLLLSTTGCAQDCVFQVPSAMGGVTGVGVNRFDKYLYTSHAPACIRVWDDSFAAAPCPASLTLLGECYVTLPPGEVITGIEFDGRSSAQFPAGRLFVVTSQKRLVVLDAPGPGGTCSGLNCTTRCGPLLLPACSAIPAFGAPQGLTYDRTNRNLWVTDGTYLLVVKEDDQCKLTLVSCCTINRADTPLSGLGWKAVPTPRVIGQPWVNPGCLGCLPPILAYAGDSSYGNPAFVVSLGNLPMPGAAALVIAPGPATSGIPFQGGTIYLGLTAPLIALPLKPTGSTGCAATASLALGSLLPASLVGLTFTVQGACACVMSSGPGLGLAAALEFVVGW